MQPELFHMANMSSESSAYFTDSGGGLVTASDLNSTEELVKMSGAKKNNSVMNSSIMFAFGVFGNILALVVLKRSGSVSDNKRKLFYRLVAGLTLTDLFGTMCTSPVVISVYMNDFKWLGGDPMCKYFAFMMVFACFGTMIIVCLMAIERLLCIRYPYLYHARLRKKHATIFLCSAWLSAAIFASLPIIGFGKIILQYPYTWCFIDYYTNNGVDIAFNCLFASLAIIIISVTVGCNVAVFITLLKTKMRGISRRRRSDSRQFAGYSKRYNECQMAVLLIGITVVFSSCYLPLMVRILINQTKLMPIDLRTDLLMIRFASMNQILDPWVYILLRREVVWHVVSTIKKLCCCKSEEELQLTVEFEIRRTGFASPTATQTSSENPTCCAFCWHCMCDPPQSVRQSSISSFYNSYHERKSIQSPTRRFLLDITNSIILPGDSSGTSLDSSFDSPVTGSKFNHESGTELKLLQPKSILKTVNGRHSTDNLDSSFDSITESKFNHDSATELKLLQPKSILKGLNGRHSTNSLDSSFDSVTGTNFNHESSTELKLAKSVLKDVNGRFCTQSLDSSFDSTINESKFNHELTTQLNLSQPRSILKDVNGRRSTNGKFNSDESDSQISEMLLNTKTENAESDI